MNRICTNNIIFVPLYYRSLTYCNIFLNFKTNIMNIIDVRHLQKETGRRKTLKWNYYVHPKSRYIGWKCSSNYFSFFRETNKLFTLTQYGFPKAWGLGLSLPEGSRQCKKWYGLKVPSTGWKKIQFVLHEPKDFLKENSFAELLKFLLSKLK